MRTKLVIFFLYIICVCSLSYMICYYGKLKMGEKEINDLKAKREENLDWSDTIVFEDQEATEKIKPIVTLTVGSGANEEIFIPEREILQQYVEMYNENTDLAGWIKIAGTPIDYPTMWTPENPTYYVDKGWDKTDNQAGLPMIDAKCSLNSNNIIIHAHNMKNGSMFGTLKKYKDKKYFEKHQTINFDSLYQTGRYQIIGVLLAKVYYNELPQDSDFVFYNYTNLDTQEEFNEYIDWVKKLSLYETGETAKYGDKLITLATCNYHTQDGRILVVAKKID